MSTSILEEIRDELMVCGAISSKREFCISWLAKDESYLRGIRHRGLNPSIDAYANCASKLGYYAHHLRNSENAHYQDWVRRFSTLRASCHDAIDMQAQAKWMTTDRMR